MLVLVSCAAASSVRAATGSVAVLNWTAPGDDGNSGTARRYDIRRSTSLLTAINFSFADTVGGTPAPAPAGTPQSCYVVLPDASKTYYFGIRTADEVGNFSTLSNIVTISALRTATPRTRMPGNADFAMPWPNPARDVSTFQLEVPMAQPVSAEVFDAAGRHVRSAFRGEMAAGTQKLDWKLDDDQGRPVAGGVYYVRVRIGDYARTRQMVVVR